MSFSLELFVLSFRGQLTVKTANANARCVLCQGCDKLGVGSVVCGLH